MGCVQNDVEQWVRQQNACRQKQEQMAAFYANQVYQSCDQIPETGHYQYWPVHHKTLSSSLGPTRAQTLSFVDYVGPAGYGNIPVDAAMNVHHFREESYKIPDELLTMEQRQQRQSKLEWLLAVQHMLTEEQQVPVTDEHADHIRVASCHQSRVPSSISWNSMPYGSDMRAGSYNSGNHAMNSSYASSAVRYDCCAPRWDAVPTSQSRWYHVQRGEHCMNKTGMQNNFDHCQSADFCNGRYFGPRGPSRSVAESCQQSVKGRVMPAHAVYDCTHLHSLCDPQACKCQGSMSSHIGKYYMQPSGMYGYNDVSMQPNCGCEWQMNRCNEFVNGSYVMPVGGSRQLTNNMPPKYQGDTNSWNSAVDGMKQRFMAVPALVQGPEIPLTPQQSNYNGTERHVVAEPVSTPISCAQAQLPTSAVRQKPAGGKKRKNSNVLTAQLADSKSKKFDSVADEWSRAVPESRGGTLMNITSASLAHLAKGVENMSAVMQQTVRKGGPFRSVQGQEDRAAAFDENANFISTYNSVQVQVPGIANPAEQPTVPASDCTPVTSSFCTVQTAAGFNKCSLAAVSTLSIENSDVTTTGVDVVVTAKTPYTISYRPSGISSEDVSQGNVDASTAARMMSVTRHVSDAHTTLSSRRYIPTGEGFSQYSHQEQCGITHHNNPADAAKVDQQAAGACMPLPMSVASSVAVVQPQIMSGTQLFIADHCPELTPVLNNFVLPTCVQSGTLRPPQSCHSLLHDPNYFSFAVQDVSASVSGSDIPVFCSSANAVRPVIDQTHSSVCTSDDALSLSGSIACGSPLSRCPQTNTGCWNQPSVSVCSRSFSQAHDVM